MAEPEGNLGPQTLSKDGSSGRSPALGCGVRPRVLSPSTHSQPRKQQGGRGSSGRGPCHLGQGETRALDVSEPPVWPRGWAVLWAVGRKGGSTCRPQVSWARTGLGDRPLCPPARARLGCCPSGGPPLTIDDLFLHLVKLSDHLLEDLLSGAEPPGEEEKGRAMEEGRGPRWAVCMGQQHPGPPSAMAYPLPNTQGRAACGRGGGLPPKA